MTGGAETSIIYGLETAMAHKPRILVVENDVPTLKQIEMTLKTMGADPRCFPSSKKAAEAITKEKFDGAFLDWDLPEVSGEELTQRIRESKSNAKMPIAMITERHDTRSIAQGFKLGVTFFLSKPIGPTELGRLLNAARGAMLEERRRYARVPTRIPVLCAWEEKKIKGQSVDVSAGGLLVALAPAPAQGSEVAVEFTLPRSPKPLSLKATVVRVAGGQVGLSFVKVTAEQRDLLKTFVERQINPLQA